eukprot:4038617-Prorocentrum_lima.AAC.1
MSSKQQLLALFSVLLGLGRAQTPPAELTLGVLMAWTTGRRPFTGPYIYPAIFHAIDEINNNPDVLNGTDLKWVWHDSQ